MKAFVSFLMGFQACLIIVIAALYLYGVIGSTSAVVNICINAVFFGLNIYNFKRAGSEL